MNAETKKMESNAKYEIYRLLRLSASREESTDKEELTRIIKEMEEADPYLPELFNLKEDAKYSLTDKQKDYICYQIGEWYLKWKLNLIDYDSRTHKLGFAKEDLKNMICGD